MSVLSELLETISQDQKVWTVTGAAGFIGSHLTEKLLAANQKVIGLDNLSTGKKENLEEVRQIVGEKYSQNFTFIEGDIRNESHVKESLESSDYILHQAALGSVPRSIADPLTTNSVNIDGFLNVASVAKNCGIRRIVYASSSSVYGDSPILPKIESEIGNQLSPYAVTKWANELYAGVFSKIYGLEFIGLRYFNVFGPRQDPNGAYAAVIPKWLGILKEQRACEIFGDGETSRDFSYIDNVVQMNLLAALTESSESVNRAYNVACNRQASLTELYELIQKEVGKVIPSALDMPAIYKEFREGDVRHSLADISLAERLLYYNPEVFLEDGIKTTVDWYLK